MNYDVGEYLKNNIQYPDLTSGTYKIDTPYDIFKHLKSMQTITLPINENYIEALFKKQYIIQNAQKKLKPKKDFSLPSYQTIQFFGSTNKLYIDTDFYLWYINRDEVYRPTEINVNIYNIESATNIPQELTNYKLPDEIQQTLSNVNPIKFNIPSQIKYNKFVNIDYMYVDSNKLPYDMCILMTNIPYQFYQKALILADHQVCYNITSSEFNFACRNAEYYQNILTDIAKNGLSQPLVLGIDQFGCLSDTSECRLRTLAALQLKIPEIPAIIYMMENSSNTFSMDNRNDANTYFNPYLYF